ncbi:MAG: hypothetical protein NTW86_09835 [Candidatus Sumerlaeota bacterium]|nr:hypothetical protein [Candidatus Sumerlaeota bacterium]
MSAITVRGLGGPTVKAIKDAAAQRSLSMNRFIVEALEKAVGVGGRKPKEYHDLDEFFGSWTQAECDVVMRRVSQQRRIDQDLWR